jgi:hypothetical protein
MNFIPIEKLQSQYSMQIAKTPRVMAAALNEQRNKELGILIDGMRDPLREPEPKPDDPYLRQLN